jgi:hypothetical protein
MIAFDAWEPEYRPASGMPNFSGFAPAGTLVASIFGTRMNNIQIHNRPACCAETLFDNDIKAPS